MLLPLVKAVHLAADSLLLWLQIEVKESELSTQTPHTFTEAVICFWTGISACQNIAFTAIKTLHAQNAWPRSRAWREGGNRNACGHEQRVQQWYCELRQRQSNSTQVWESIWAKRPSNSVVI